MSIQDNMQALLAMVNGQEPTQPTYSGSILTQYRGGQVLEPQQSAEEKAINANKVRESQAKANKAELSALQAAQTVDPNFFKQTVGFEVPDFNSTGALSQSAPEFFSNLNYSNGFNYEPVASTPEDNQVVTQQATPEQNNSAQGNSNTIMSASGVPLPSNESLEKEYQDNTVTKPMTGSGNSDAEANADLLAKRYASDYQNKKAASVLKEKQESRDYLMTHGIDEQGKYFELDSQGNKKYPWQPGTIRRGLEKVKKATAALGVATALTSPTVASAVNSQDPTTTTTNNTTSQQQTTTTQDQGALSANDPNNGVAPDKGGAVYKATPQEKEGINAAMNAALNGTVGKPELTNLISSIGSIKDNAIEELNRQSYLLGGASGLEYAVKNGEAGAEQVAQDFIQKHGLEPRYLSDVTRTINKLNGEYKNLTPAVIATVIGANSRNDAEWVDKGFDTDIGGGLEYLDADVASTLTALNDRSAATSYERTKDAYNRCKEMMNDLGDVETAVETAMKHYNTHMRDLTTWGNNPKSELRQKWLKEDAENTNKYAYIAGQKALDAFKKLGSFYNSDGRVTWEEAKIQPQSNTSTQPTSTNNASALEKAAGYGLIH